jgi:signal peptidase I
MVRWVIGVLILIPIAIIWAFFLGGHWQTFKVISRSMEPTLLVDDYLVMRQQKHYPVLDNKIVVLKDPEGGTFPVVKRVIAGPHSIVKLRSGKVYLDNSKSPVPGEPVVDARNKSWTLKEDEIFVMGDNRNNSEDSTEYGPLKRTDILGVIAWRYWPFDRIGGVQ